MKRYFPIKLAKLSDTPDQHNKIHWQLEVDGEWARVVAMDPEANAAQALATLLNQR